ncbi:MAG: gamma-glutamyltransferase family protein [Pigmentiphaga sp.]|uniref:gamma-glutamyltransferase family protein n=1 Tax=Pigmentiphaga sp. TaxID=1977564 RepID=UPI0029B79B71|nr:gamma-glutamyltransferase family protein [Pigmentiphaga sp.]MDX3907473.1 gamma-glutamyltransferase family protein [Pigmentiphaga sp.]
MDWSFPHPSRRSPVLADNVVAASQPLAARAGVAMLEQGGNAVDAAIAAAAALTVVEPVMNGLGGDAQVLMWDGQSVVGLNGCGKSPAAWSPERFGRHTRMPDLGWESVIVPGAVALWADLSARYGKLPFDTLLAPAIRYAHDGFLVSPIIARQWVVHADRLKEQPGFAAAFMPGGRAPQAGERFRFPALGRSLERIAATRGRDFYEGDIAAAVVADADRHGAALSAQDLAAHCSEWVAPLGLRYRGLDVYQMPPPAQGLAVLSALGIMQHFDLGPSQDPALRMHVQIEAMKMAFADVYAHLADAAWMQGEAAALLDPEYLRSRAARIDPSRAAAHPPCTLPRHATVYLAVADRDGMVVSFIQSNFHGFGSGVVVPDTGVSFHNRGSGFSLEAGHPNQVAGAKKPFHTIVPGLLVRDGSPWGALGVVGADMQPQGQVQIISALEDLGLNPQAALDLPRWRIDPKGAVRLEAAVAPEIEQGLAARGHPVVRMPPGNIDFGGAQCVVRVGDGYAGASDASRDGSAVGF